ATSGTKRTPAPQPVGQITKFDMCYYLMTIIPVGVSMAKDRLQRKLVVILHADVAGSTQLVQKDDQLAHERIQDAFHRFSNNIEKYKGRVLELRGDALLAEFERPSDAVTATFAFQADQAYHNSRIKDDLQPSIRVGIAMGEVIIADDTVTGAGVVLAQRVEQLADPGGLCITSALHESLPKRMPFDLENLGIQELKGIDDPVHVFRVELRSGASIPAPEQQNRLDATSRPWRFRLTIAVGVMVIAVGIAYLYKSSSLLERHISPANLALPLPDKPSIAVLPFTNISDDPKQEYFVDGMTEDLITDLSKLSGMFVIARNSVFTYKNKPVKISQIANELGVRYILEGSVRRAGEQIRINAQLIDATTGGHLWAERYDGKFDDIFALQDKITRKIVTALSVNLTPKEERQRTQKYTDNVQAYDEFLQGRNLGSFNSPEEFDKKIRHFEKAIELDPDYGHAHAALAHLYDSLRSEEREKTVGISRQAARAKAYFHIAESKKNPTPLTHRVHAKLLSRDRKWDEAVIEAGKAINLNPNDSDGYYAMSDLLIRMGRPAEAQVYLNEVIRLNPRGNFFFKKMEIEFHLERYPEVVENLLTHLEDYPNHEWDYMFLAASYGHLGLKAEGKAAIQKFEELRSKLGHAEPYRTRKLYTWRFKDEKARDRVREGLQKAGMSN
ncbi:MAG: adenylate/guanylate cyclase domain-containing protein, partial [Nitrospirota bacterium]|nr:adenylate/guanylate cyclase domain-containing protein [Nitrospirota bacterium]